MLCKSLFLMNIVFLSVKLGINGIPSGDNELKTRAIAQDKTTIFITLYRLIKNFLCIFKTPFLKIKIIFLKPFDFQFKGYKFHL